MKRKRKYTKETGKENIADGKTRREGGGKSRERKKRKGKYGNGERY